MHRRLAGIWICILAACGGGDAPPGNEPAAAGQREARFVARDFAFDGPRNFEGGLVTLVLENEGETLHHLQLLRLRDGRTAEDFATVFATLRPGDPFPEWAELAGGVNPPPPDAAARVTLSLEPGEYAVVCFVDMTDHVPHVVKGMVAPLTVTEPSSAEVAPPASTLDLTLVDYAFGFSSPPTEGRHVIRIRNAGPQPHEIALFRLHEGRTQEELITYLRTYEGEMPGSPVGGIPGFPGGGTAYAEIDLVPGTYVALCFVPDSTDGRGHLEHGMVTTFTIT